MRKMLLSLRSGQESKTRQKSLRGVALPAASVCFMLAACRRKCAKSVMSLQGLVHFDAEACRLFERAKKDSIMWPLVRAFPPVLSLALLSTWRVRGT